MLVERRGILRGRRLCNTLAQWTLQNCDPSHRPIGTSLLLALRVNCQVVGKRVGLTGMTIHDLSGLGTP
jgi:hypothetical protein